MAELPEGVFGCVTDGVIRVRVQGRAVALQCPGIREFVKDGLAAGARSVRIELGECEYFDSTFMGTLLRIRKAVAEADADGPILVDPSEDAGNIVRRMGLARLFDLDAEPPPPTDDWQPIVEERPGTKSWEFRENVVTAHRELADASEACAEIYDSIADEAARDLEDRPPASE